MNKLKLMASLMGAATILAPTVAMADTQSVSNAPMVWVAQDVTRQMDYTISYNGQSNQAPLGSLVKYEEIPLSEAVAEHLRSIVADPNDSDAASRGELESLHKALFEQLNPNVATSQSMISPNATSPATGSFSDFTDGVTWSYAIYYSDGSGGYVNVSSYSIIANPAYTHATLDTLTWDGHTDSVYSTIPDGGYSTGLSWSGSAGYQFTTLVSYNLNTYSGYTTLY